MKNGDPRSAKWIARALKKFERDDEILREILHLVDVRPTPPADEIRTWTDAQCLLAEDWARAVHYSASDNNNRVPAVPAHLESYIPAYPQRSPQQAAVDIVKDMGDDNGCDFDAGAEQMAALTAALGRMQAAGCHFTDAEVWMLAAGEETEVVEAFTSLDGDLYDGFVEAHDTLNAIFDSPADPPARAVALATKTTLNPAAAWPFPKDKK